MENNKQIVKLLEFIITCSHLLVRTAAVRHNNQSHSCLRLFPNEINTATALKHVIVKRMLLESPSFPLLLTEKS